MRRCPARGGPMGFEWFPGVPADEPPASKLPTPAARRLPACDHPRTATHRLGSASGRLSGSEEEIACIHAISSSLWDGRRTHTGRPRCHCWGARSSASDRPELEFGAGMLLSPRTRTKVCRTLASGAPGPVVEQRERDVSFRGRAAGRVAPSPLAPRTDPRSTGSRARRGRHRTP